MVRTMKDWLKRLVYDEQYHRELYAAWRQYPYAMRNTVATFVMLGFALGTVFGYFAGLNK
jgi:hypothetical protein